MIVAATNKGILKQIEFRETHKENCDKRIKGFHDRIGREENKKKDLDEQIEYLKSKLSK